MRTFRDDTGRIWTLAVNVGTVKRVRALCQVDLASIVSIDPGHSPDVGLLERLGSDPVLLVDVLYAVCKPEADALGVTDEAFGQAMSGDAIELATAALLDEVIDFFPQAKRMAFRRILEASRRFAERGKKELEHLLEDPEFDGKLDRAMEQLTDSSFGLRESQESLPTR